MNVPGRISEEDEAELRVATAVMYRHGGMENVLACVLAMQKAAIIIMKKLNELMDEESAANDSPGGTN